MQEKYYWVGLSRLNGLGPVSIAKLLKYYHTSANIWNHLNENILLKLEGIGPKSAKKILLQKEKVNLRESYKYLKKRNIKTLIIDDKNYPEILKKIYDPPPVLYYKGKEINKNMTALAIVGSRRSTVYGKKVAKRLAYKLAIRGITIVSGMATGIDSYGHLGSLQAGGNTIAVLGSGLDYIYPEENKELYSKIINNGTVISEFYPDIEPLKSNFPRRNRIISGLCRGVIVVEAAGRSGSLITANLALEQNREVFAVPGNIDSVQSKGCNNLIKEGACMVTSAKDILDELFLYNDSNYNEEQVVMPGLDSKEENIIELFKKNSKLTVDDIIEISDFDVNEINSILLKLELKGIIEKIPGKKYYFKGLQNLLKPI